MISSGLSWSRRRASGVRRLDDGYPSRSRRASQHVIVGGRSNGHGPSREHATIAPRHLGLRLVIAKSYVRIQWQNLANFGGGLITEYPRAA
jgi:3-isopropylmalate dehydratase small subunit